MKNAVPITGVHLVRIGEHVIVSVELDGHWIDIIREHHDGSFSHICESAGIRNKQREHAEKWWAERNQGGTEWLSTDQPRK